MIAPDYSGEFGSQLRVVTDNNELQIGFASTHICYLFGVPAHREDRRTFARRPRSVVTTSGVYEGGALGSQRPSRELGPSRRVMNGFDGHFGWDVHACPGTVLKPCGSADGVPCQRSIGFTKGAFAHR